MPGIPQTKPKDDVDWYPYLLLSRRGATGPQLATLSGMASSTVNRHLRRLRTYDEKTLADIRERARQRRRDDVEVEFLIGDPAKAIRLANACAALLKQDQAQAEADQAREDLTEEEAGDDDAQKARDDAFLRRHILDHDSAGALAGLEGEGGSPDPGRHPGRLPLPRDGPATPATG